MADQPKTQAGQGAAVPDEEQEHGGGERFNRRLLVIAGVFAVVVGVIAGEGIRSAGVKATGAGTQPPGSGLGLAIVKAIADAHGASVQLADGPDGRGFSVSVTFPGETAAASG